MQKLTGGKIVWLGLVSKFRPGSWQLYQTEEAARYFNFNVSKAVDQGGECAMMGGRGGGWGVSSCQRREVEGGRVVVLCERLPGVVEEGRVSIKTRTSSGP